MSFFPNSAGAIFRRQRKVRKIEKYYGNKKQEMQQDSMNESQNRIQKI
jgi:hypothetical protein